MNDNIEPILEAYRTSIPRPQKHPDIGDLVSFTDDGLVGERAERISSHLEICRDCAAMVIHLKKEAHENKMPEGNSRKSRLWQKLSHEIDKTSEPLSPKKSETLSLTPFKHWSIAGSGYIAAALVLIFLLPKQPETLTPIQPNPQLISLDPEATNRGPEQEVPNVPIQSNLLVFTLTSPEIENFSKYTLTIESLDTGQSFEVKDLRQKKSGAFEFAILFELISPGVNSMKLYGVENEKVLLKTYRFDNP